MLAVLAYVPLLLTDRGRVVADTKQYLYLDPDRLLGRAASMWDPNIGLGTVSHQTIGYLFPMGPFYWVLEHVGVPDWIAQRLWMGSLLFLAGLGVLYLLRTLNLRGAVLVVAPLAYMLSPYVLDFVARLSAILMPWAGLPWMIALVVRALRQGGWRYPALFALVVTLVGGVNATSLLYAGVGPLLWFPYAVWVTREIPLRRALATVGRIGVLTLGASLWWIAGLWAQGGYGIDILRYTETVKTVARTSLASEVLRGLGYWYFYGSDKIGPWIEPSVYYTQHLWLILASYALPALACLAAAWTRWRHRAYFVCLIVVGVVLAVGTHPYDNPSILGAVLKSAGQGSTAGLAMRSTGRAVPLVALGTSVLLGLGASALVRLDRRRGLWATGAVVALVAVSIAPLWGNDFLAPNLERDEDVPAYWRQAAAWLDGQGHDTRVLTLPGADFAAYRWGDTVDPILPGLMDRPFVARELIPYGSPPSADLLNAFDRRLQEGVFEPTSLVPVARLMAAGHVVLRNDLQYERFNTPRPRSIWLDFMDPRPQGLAPPVTFGPGAPNRPAKYPLEDERALALPAGAPHPPEVAAFPVEGAQPIVRAVGTGRPTVLAGDGEGVVDSAAAGVVDGRSLLLYAAAMDDQELRRALDAGADLVLTDTNRRRGRRWSTVRDNTGYTEQADEDPLEDDPSDNRLEVFPGASDDSFTVTEQRGVARVQASAYGNPVSFTPEVRGALAFDGDLSTSWRVAAFDDPRGERLVIELDQPVRADRVTLVQPLDGPRGRFVTEATLRIDDGDPIEVDLGDDSRTASGQEVRFPAREVKRLEVTIDQTNLGPRVNYSGTDPVGFAEVGLGGERVEEVVRMPRDFRSVTALDHRTIVVMTRVRTAPVPPRNDEERAIVRSFELASPRGFAVSGTARLSSAVPDDAVDSVLGAPGPEAGGVAARSSDRLPGALRARAASALDGDPATAWVPGFGPQQGRWVEYDLPRSVTFDRLDLVVMADGRHSVPDRLRVEAGGQSRIVELTQIEPREEEGATASVPVSFPPLTGERVRVTVESVRPVENLDYFSDGLITQPVAIAEVGIPGVATATPPPQLPAACRSDLATLDGRPLSLRLVGTTAGALDGDALRVEGCDGDAQGFLLGGSEHLLRSRSGASSGIDLDRLVLASDRGGGPLLAGPSAMAPPPPAALAVEVLEPGRTSMKLRVAATSEPFWLVLGQSHNSGWRASAGGRSLGAPTLVDGYANGWYVDPAGDGDQVVDVTVRWAPQRWVWVALALSGLSVVACGLLVGFDPGRAKRPAAIRPEEEEPLLRSPLAVTGWRPGDRATTIAAVGVGLVTALVSAWPLGVLVGALTAAVLRRPKLRIVLAVGPAVLVAFCGLYIAVQQLRYGYPPAFEWPTHFGRTHLVAWLAVALLGADVVVGLLRNRPGRRSRAPT